MPHSSNKLEFGTALENTTGLPWEWQKSCRTTVGPGTVHMVIQWER